MICETPSTIGLDLLAAAFRRPPAPAAKPLRLGVVLGRQAAELALDATATQADAEEQGVIDEHVAAYKAIQIVARAAAEAARAKP